MTGKDRARMAVYAMAGIYLLMMSYQMFQTLSTAGEEKLLMVIFMIVFVIVGIGLVGLGIYDMYKNSKKKDDKEE